MVTIPRGAARLLSGVHVGGCSARREVDASSGVLDASDRDA